MGFATPTEQLQALRRPFPVEEVKTREESGKTLQYYEGATIMRRLTDVMGTGYSIKTGRIERYDVEGKPRRIDMEVTVALTWLDGTVSSLTGWGSADIQYSKSDTWRIVSDFMKSAHTDGIKVALSKIGLGAELYDSTYRASLDAQMQQAEEAARQKAMFTCHHCQGEITGGMVGDKDLTAQDVVNATRKKFKKRLCIHCATAEAKAAKVAA